MVLKYNKTISEQIFIILGIILMNLGFYFFFLPQRLVTGGVTGIAVILENNPGAFSIKASYTIFILNGVFLIIGYFVLGKTYAIKTLFGSLFSPFVIFLLEISNVDHFYIIDQINEVKLIFSTVLGSLFIGIGLGIVFRNGGSTGGIDIGQNILNKKLHLNYRVIFAITDGIIVLIGLLVFKDLERFFYAIGAILMASTIVDNLSIAGRAGHTLFIVTDKEEAIKEAIYQRVDRGTTILDAKGGYYGTEKKLIICVIHKRELNLTRAVIEQTDPNAFTFIAQTKEAVGHGFSR